MKRISVLLAAVLFAEAGCSDQQYGEDIGRPPIEPVDGPDLLPLIIDEVDAGYATPYAVVASTASDGDVDLSSLELCDESSCVQLDGTLAPGVRHRVDVSSLGLSASAGELAVVDGDGGVQAFIAWGAAPRVLGWRYVAGAASRGLLPAGGGFVRLPYPAPADVAVAQLASGESGCASPTADAGSGVSATPPIIDDELCPAAADPATQLAPVLQLEELMPAQPDGGGSWVELTSITDEPLALYGVRLCQPPSCMVFGHDFVLPAGGRLVVHLGTAGETTAQDYYDEVAAPLASTGDLVLLAPGPVDIAYASMQSYVRYGGGQSDLTAIATAARFPCGGTVCELWPADADVIAPRAAGESLSLNWGSAVGSSAWFPVYPPTPGADNPVISSAADWTSCSAPSPWSAAEPSQLVIDAVQPTTIELVNRGDSDVDLDAYTLQLEGTSLTLGVDETPDDPDTDPPTMLAAGATLTVSLAQDCAEADTVRCWAQTLPLDPGELTLLENGVIRQHLQWSSAPDATTWLRADDAVAAGVWPLSRCALPALEADTSIELTPGAAGQSPPDYTR